MGFVDTSGQVFQVGMAKAKKRRRTIKERRDIVEETLVPGASVARVARRHDVNANQVFYWRKLYREGRLGISMATHRLPVKVEGERPAETVKGEDLTLSKGSSGSSRKLYFHLSRRAGRCHSHRRSLRCCSRESIGAGRCAHRHRSWRSKQWRCRVDKEFICQEF
jgi:transposase